MLDSVLNFIEDYFPGFDRRGSEVNFNSPFFPDTKKRLYVNLDSGKWFDQHDQRGSNNFEAFVSEYLGISYVEATKLMMNYHGFDKTPNLVDIRDIISGSQIDDIDYNITVNDPLDVHPIMFDDCDELDNDGEEAIRYLQQRRISPKGLGYFKRSDADYSGRIFIPFYENGKLVYFLARSYIGSELRYKNPVLETTNVVYNIDNIDDTVVVFEGVFDAMSLDNMIGTAMLSNKIKDGQAKKLARLDKLKNVIFVPDVDENKETRKIILNNLIYNIELIKSYKKISKVMNFYIYRLPEGYKDFGELKQKTGVGEIDIKDCEEFNKSKILFDIMRL